MKIPDFLFALVEKFAPMGTTDRTELKNECAEDYVEIKKSFFDSDTKKIIEGKNLSELTIKQKIVYFGEKWQTRLALALLFIWIVPQIQKYQNPPNEDIDD